MISFSLRTRCQPPSEPFARDGVRQHPGDHPPQRFGFAGRQRAVVPHPLHGLVDLLPVVGLLERFVHQDAEVAGASSTSSSSSK
ncbi:MAG: hypothetical protein ACLUQ6_02145 [Alistipes onderdonkii]